MPITARYMFSFEDYKELVRSLVFRPQSFRGWLVALMLMLWFFQNAEYGFAISKAPGWLGLRKELIAEFVWLAIVLAVFEAVLRLSLFERASFKRCPIADKLVSYQLSDKGISWSRDGMRGEYDWSVVKAAIINPAAITLMISKREGVILPLRAFTSQEEFEATANLTQARAPAEKLAPETCAQDPK